MIHERRGRRKQVRGERQRITCRMNHDHDRNRIRMET